MILVAESVGPGGAGPWEALAARVERHSDDLGPRAVLLGYHAQLPLDALVAAAGPLIDQTEGPLIAVGQLVGRAIGAPTDLEPCTWTDGARRVAWVPGPTTPWWRDVGNRIRATGFLIRELQMDGRPRSISPEVFPVIDPPVPRATSAHARDRALARIALEAACCATGVMRGVVLSGTNAPPAAATRMLAAWLARELGASRGATAQVLKVSHKLVTHCAWRFARKLTEPAVVALSIQGSLAAEVIDHLELQRRLPTDLLSCAPARSVAVADQDARAVGGSRCAPPSPP